MSQTLCKDCGKKYTDVYYKWCKPCQISNLKDNFENWTSGNKQIDDFIQEKQLKINYYRDIIFEWIPYSQFNIVKEDRKDYFTMHSAIWKDGPLCFERKWTRKSNKTVDLKCFYHSQNIDEFLNEV